MNNDWNLSPAEARMLQEKLRNEVRLIPLNLNSIRYVGGADISCMKHDPWLYAAIVVLDFDRLEPVDIATASLKSAFPYIPGLLSFRESPAIIKSWEKLRIKPDVLICDGQGIAHPRRFGIASHLGLLLNLPTVGCAKKVLTGTYDSPRDEEGGRSNLMDGEEAIGAVLRTRTRVKPVFVSPGHLCDVDSAVDIVRGCLRRHRLPETTRWAHRLSNEFRIKCQNLSIEQGEQGDK